MIKKIDHTVITTGDSNACIAFYKQLGFQVHDADGRYELFAGDFKINVHIKGNELSPHAANVQTGSADLCFEIVEDLRAFQQDLIEKGIAIELGIVDRTGVHGAMQSIYLRDPDGNLLEFSCYERTHSQY